LSVIDVVMFPLPFIWPLALVFWLVFVWAFWPEFRVLREARLAQRSIDADARDPSYGPLVMGQRIAMFVAILVAVFLPRVGMRDHRVTVFLAGLLVMIVASLLRRHCFRMLGRDFQGAVTVRPDQPVVERGAYRVLRHPSYSAAILLHIGFVLSFSNWVSLAIILIFVTPLFVYRIGVEERALQDRLGNVYASYMTRTSRLIPGVW